MSIELKRTPTDDEVEQICIAAEEAAKKLLLHTVPLKRISDLDVTVEATCEKPLTLNVDVAVDLTIGEEDLETLLKEATKQAFIAAENKVRELNLCVTTPD
jgi:hypothetical protein